MQRLRVRFGRGDEIKYLSHLDLLRLWERAMRRAGLPLAYSEGFTPHPRLSLAAPLPVGITSEAELADISLSRWLAPVVFLEKLRACMPTALDLMDAQAIGLNVPSLQSLVYAAEYEVTIATTKTAAEMESSVRAILDAREIPWSHRRGEGMHSYDMRPLIQDMWLVRCLDGVCTVGMMLRSDSGGSGRPEQVINALMASPQVPVSIHRTKLLLRTIGVPGLSL